MLIKFSSKVRQSTIRKLLCKNTGIAIFHHPIDKFSDLLIEIATKTENLDPTIYIKPLVYNYKDGKV